jgi:hypothetical protein
VKTNEASVFCLHHKATQYLFIHKIFALGFKIIVLNSLFETTLQGTYQFLCILSQVRRK